MKSWLSLLLILCAAGAVNAQNSPDPATAAGFVPVLSGGVGYIHNVDGGAPTLEPQINPVLLVPLGRHVLLESRTDFTGFFQRQNLTSGSFKGKVFKTVEFAQVDWLANTHAIVTAGRYLLPFGLYGERLEPIWIRNLQDSPITATIGTRTSGAGDGLMLRGVLAETSSYSIQYTSYFSVRSNVNQLQAARTAGADGSIFLHGPRLELGASYQHFLQQHQINSVATYLSWQAPAAPLDIKLEYDHSYNGHGYWLESAYLLKNWTVVPSLVTRLQAVARVQQYFPAHGGGKGVPVLNTNRVDFGLNYYFRDNLRLISSYGRQFSSQGNGNVWNAGVTYRFIWPLWHGGTQ